MVAELATRRLRLSTFGPSDAADLHVLFSDPRTHTIGGGPFTSIGQTGRWLARRDQVRADLGFVWYGVRLNGTLIGNCGVFPGRTGAVEPEIGYLIHWPFQGRGFAGEAVGALLGECRRAGIGRVWATIRERNAASRRIVERHGMSLIRTELEDLLFYALKF
ncbi:GNAT family N-acetyltransferase [Actinoplanes campanulatus]|nr:GNAT family N-acetyltransferase [Actinoplanes campanulatus]GID35229.1 hypothetical protein Aca09nite_17350 [Actinoplanes campanulatus]